MKFRAIIRVAPVTQYESMAQVPTTQLVKESLAWLDRYLGPVR